MTAKARVTVIGALPPPMHGAARVTALISAALGARATVGNLNTAPPGLSRGPAYHVRRVMRVLSALVRLCAGGFGARAGAVYLSAAGGPGVVYDIMIVAVTRSLNRPLFIHHHSFAYIDRFDWTRAAFARIAGSKARHICLCPCMADRLRQKYAAVHRTLVLSNAAFFPPPPAMPLRAPRLPRAGLVLGHLSNLTRDKGLDLVIETFAAAGADADRLVLAGAAADAQAEDMLAGARSRFSGRLEERGHVEGDDKTRFFADIDVFLFPTRYINEAEPLVVIEALAAGVPVIAYGRGCIPRMIPAGAGLVVAVDGPYPAGAVDQIRTFANDPAVHAAARARARAAARAAYDQALPMRDGVLDAIVHTVLIGAPNMKE